MQARKLKRINNRNNKCAKGSKSETKIKEINSKNIEAITEDEKDKKIETRSLEEEIIKLDNTIQQSCCLQVEEIDFEENGNDQEVSVNSESEIGNLISGGHGPLKKILINGDEYAKGFSRVLESVMEDNEYKITEHIECKEELAVITKDLFSHTTLYGQNDFIIVMFNTKNISNGRSLKKALRCILPMSKFTNLHMIAEVNAAQDRIITNNIWTGHNIKK